MRGGSFGVGLLLAWVGIGCETGDSGGEPVPDAAAILPDAAVVLPDAAVVLPDLGPVLPDVAAVDPADAVGATADAAVDPADAVGATADMAVVPADAAVDPADAGTDPADAAAMPPDAAAPPPPDAGPPTLGTVTPADLFAALPGDEFLLIDVHVPYAGELPNTDAHIVYTDTAALLAYIGPDRDTPVVLYCLTDHMSLIAGDALVAEGYRGVRSLAGGMRAWEAAGFPLEHRP